MPEPTSASNRALPHSGGGPGLQPRVRDSTTSHIPDALLQALHKIVGVPALKIGAVQAMCDEEFEISDGDDVPSDEEGPPRSPHDRAPPVAAAHRAQASSPHATTR